MATRTIVTVTDDLDGSETGDISTSTFGLDGDTFEIDLSEANRLKLAAALEPYIRNGRAVSAKARTPRLYGANRRNGGTHRIDGKSTATPRIRASRPDFADIRAWAAAEGFRVSERGRIADAIVDKYDRRNDMPAGHAGGGSIQEPR